MRCSWTATCIETARRLIENRKEGVLSPLALLDLSTFVTAYCLHDRLAFLHNDLFGAPELDQLFGSDAFVELPVHRPVDSETRSRG